MNDRDYTTMKKAELLSTVEELRDHLDRLENQDAVYDLTLSEARYRALFEGSSDFIYVLDSGGYFTFANAESGHLLGYDPEEIIGKHFDTRGRHVRQHRLSCRPTAAALPLTCGRIWMGLGRLGHRISSTEY